MGLLVVVIALIAFGLIPKSCGRFLPVVGRYYTHYCTACGGDGRVEWSCPKCNRQGYFAGARCPVCSGRGRVTKTCEYCVGSGQKPADMQGQR
ncbi:MAG: hypothetical protein U0871_28295 [Gemmataceae bacterium]